MKRLRRLSLLLGPLMVVLMLANIIAGISPVEAARSTGSSLGKATGVSSTEACPTDASAITSMSVRITRGANTINAANLSSVLPGDTVRVTFDLDDDCVNYRVSLVSYKAPDATNNLDSLPQRVLNSQNSNLFGSSGGSLTVAVPNCYHATILAVGSVLTTMSPAATYGNRQKDTKNGGTFACAGVGAPSPFFYVEGNQNCAYLGNLYGETWAEYKIDATPTNGTRTIQTGYTVTVSGSNNANTFSWSSAGTALKGVFVKASTGGNLYRYAAGSFSGSNLKSVGKPDGTMYNISHVSFCFAPIPTTAICPEGKSAVTSYRFELWRGGTKINATDLNGVQSGDLVKTFFDLAPGCSNIRLSSASYETVENYYNVNTVDQQRYIAYTGDTGLFSATQSSSQRMLQSLVPNCYFQIDFVYGPIIENLTPENLYGNDKFSWKNGGNPQCAWTITPTATFTPDTTATKAAQQTATKVSQQTGTAVSKTQTAVAPPTQTAVSKTQTSVAKTATSVSITSTVIANLTGTSVAKTATHIAGATGTSVVKTQTVAANQTGTSTVKTATASANQTGTTTAATASAVAKTETAAANETGTSVASTASAIAATATTEAGQTATSDALTTTAQPAVTQTEIAKLTQTAGPGTTATADAATATHVAGVTETADAETATHVAGVTETAIIVSQTAVAATVTHVAGVTETAISVSQTAVAETATHVAGVTETFEADGTATSISMTETVIAAEVTETAVAGVTETFVAAATEISINQTETAIANETGTADAETATIEAQITGTAGAIETQTVTAQQTGTAMAMPGSIIIHKVDDDGEDLFGACFFIFAPSDYENEMMEVCDNDPGEDANDTEGWLLIENLAPTNGVGLGYMIMESSAPEGYEGDFNEKYAHVFGGSTNYVTVTIENEFIAPPGGSDMYLFKLVCDTPPTEPQKAQFRADGTLPPTCTLGDPNTNWTFEILSDTGDVITNVEVGPDGMTTFHVGPTVPDITVVETGMDNPLIQFPTPPDFEFLDIHCPCGFSELVIVNLRDQDAIASATAAAMPTATP